MCKLYTQLEQAVVSSENWCELTWDTYLQRGISLALSQQISTRHFAKTRVRIFGQVEVNGSHAWVLWRVGIPGYNALSDNKFSGIGHESVGIFTVTRQRYLDIYR